MIEEDETSPDKVKITDFLKRNDVEIFLDELNFPIQSNL